MKCACLVLTTECDCLRALASGVVNACENAGHEFAEIRLLRSYDEGAMVAAVQDCKQRFDDVFVFINGYSLAIVGQVVSTAFGGEFTQTSAQGAGIFTDARKTLFLMPHKDESYVSEICLPYLAKKYAIRLGCLVFRCVGVDATRLQNLLAQAETMACGKVKIRVEGSLGEHVIRVYYNEQTPRMLTDDLVRFFAQELEDNLYALEDKPLENMLVDLLRIRRKRIAVAESFTGGGIAKKIVSVPGASDVYYEGINAYSGHSKMARLGVSEFTLRSQGAVSEQTAYEMAAGLLQQGNCDVAIATTGLSGPTTDESGQPVGTCYIAVGVDGDVYVYRYLLQGDREEISETAIRYALFLACKQLKNM